jgi:beta-glucosidase
MQGRTYRYFSGKPLYEFGFGLSYTTFAYEHLRAPSAKLKAGEPVVIEADVKNTGAIAGDEVAELYLKQPSGFQTPLRELAGFHRVHLAPGESTHLTFTLDPRSVGQVDAQGNRVILPGVYRLTLGGSQAGAVSGSFTIADSATLPR